LRQVAISLIIPKAEELKDFKTGSHKEFNRLGRPYAARHINVLISETALLLLIMRGLVLASQWKRHITVLKLILSATFMCPPKLTGLEGPPSLLRSGYRIIPGGKPPGAWR
jgi:hypothetical protein